MEEVKRINRFLAKEYGQGIFRRNSHGRLEKFPDSRPLWQIVWSDEAREMVRGEFNEFHGPLFVRTSYGIHSKLKYSYIKSRWILEGLVWEPRPEYPDSEKGHYEIFWFFEFPDGGYQKPELEKVKVLVDTIMESQLGKRHKKTDKDFWNEDREAFDKEVAEFEDIIDTSVMQTQFRHKEAVFVGKAAKSATAGDTARKRK